MIRTYLSSDKSSEALQAELADLCGYDQLDMIGAVLERSEALRRSPAGKSHSYSDILKTGIQEVNK